MVAATAESIFVDGLYTQEQAARLARLSPRTLHRWLDGDSATQPALRRHMPSSDSAVISFVDFVQILAIRAIRKTRSLSLQKIRQTVVEADRLGISFPFARRHQTYLFADDVVIKLDDGAIIGVTGKYKQQHLIKPVVEVYLDDLTFDVSGLAAKYTPLREEGRQITINPAEKYGAPIVTPCGYTVSSLVSAVDSEGSIPAAASAYEVNEADVRFALKYDDLLAGTAA